MQSALRVLPLLPHKFLINKYKFCSATDYQIETACTIGQVPHFIRVFSRRTAEALVRRNGEKRSKGAGENSLIRYDASGNRVFFSGKICANRPVLPGHFPVKPGNSPTEPGRLPGSPGVTRYFISFGQGVSFNYLFFYILF